MQATIDTLIRRNAGLLEQLETALAALSPATYTARPARRGGSIGAQTRHVLDHYDRLLAREGVQVDYAQRARDPETEQDAAIALARAAETRRALFRLPSSDQSLAVRDSEDAPLRGFTSSLARELAFVASHTVHHLALIALLAEWQGEAIPEHFGVAPSTLEHRAREAARA